MRDSIAEPRIRIAPSILAADFVRLGEQVAIVEQAGADLLHLDVMDGHFVPNITIGPPVVQALRRVSGLFFDVHLMIADPVRYAEPFARAGSDLLTFHIEVAQDPRRVADHIRGLGVRVGVSLNPGTPVGALAPVLDEMDLVLVMSVWPGFGGQAFMPEVLEKVRDLRRQLRADQRLEIDGGIDLQTAPLAVEAGADTLVAGSAIFDADSPADALRALRQAACARHGRGEP